MSERRTILCTIIDCVFGCEKLVSYGVNDAACELGEIK